MSLRTRTLFTVVVVASGGLLGACSAEGEGDDAAVRIDGVDINYDEDTYEVGAGPLRIEFRNRGSFPHNLVFREAEGAPEASGKDEFVPAGKNQIFDVDVAAGEYAFYCSVVGHEAAGMVGTLVVG